MALCTVVLGQVFHNFLHHRNTVSRLILLIVSQWQKTVVNLSRVNVVIIRMNLLLLLLKDYRKGTYMVFMRMGKEPSCYLSPSVLNVFCKVGSMVFKPPSTTIKLPSLLSITMEICCPLCSPLIMVMLAPPKPMVLSV